MLIGISGKIGSGKNEFADMLSYLLFKKPKGTYNEFREAQDIRNTFLKAGNIVEAERTLPNIHAFADNLKKCIADCTGIKFYELNDRNVKSSEISWLNISYRKLLQEFGEGIRQAVDKNFWVNSLLFQYNNSKNWIISDVRHIEEAEAIHARDGILIRIERDVNHDDTHISEVSLDNYNNWDLVIDNNYNLDELFDTAQFTVKVINKY